MPDQGRRGEHSHHARGQQVRRGPRPGGGDERRGGHVQEVEVRLHGDVGQDQPQRQGAVPGAAEPGEAQDCQPPDRWQKEQAAETGREAQGEVCGHVSAGAGSEEESGTPAWPRATEEGRHALITTHRAKQLKRLH